MTDGGSTREPPTPPGRARESLLSETFVSLADTLVDDYDIDGFLDLLVASCMGLFDISAAGIVLVDARGNLSPTASSNEEARVLGLFELQSAEGPCLESVSSGRVVASADLTREHERWPKFAPAALGAGFRSVQSLPMRLRAENIGGLSLFGAEQPPLTPEQREVAQALADVATVGILQQRSLHRASLLAEQMQTALDSRVVIEQAKGILAESGRLDMSSAFEAMRGYARGSNQKLGLVAEALAGRRLDPATVLAAGRRNRVR
jgi:GAF domain-containing protein